MAPLVNLQQIQALESKKVTNPNTKSPAKVPAPKQAAKSWTCKNCQSENAGQSSVCAMCGHSRGSWASLFQKRAGNQGADEQPSAPNESEYPKQLHRARSCPNQPEGAQSSINGNGESQSDDRSYAAYKYNFTSLFLSFRNILFRIEIFVE